MQEMAHIFGYVNHPSEPENPTAFFEYPEDNVHASEFKSFRKINEESIDWVSSQSAEELNQIKY